jgi:Zn ribbon nucleic-acid-binding protein
MSILLSSLLLCLVVSPTSAAPKDNIDRENLQSILDIQERLIRKLATRVSYMSSSAVLRFWAECPECKTKLVLPEWSESSERETINFWHCLDCEKEFETIDQRVAIGREVKQPQFAAEFEEPFLPGLLAA